MLVVNRVSTKNHQVDSSSGAVTAQKSTNSAAHVTPLGLYGTTASRERTSVDGTTVKTVTFSTGVKQIAISVYREAAFTPGTNVDDVYSFVFNADDSTAATLLARADSSSATVSHILVRANEQPRIVDFPSTNLCTRVDMIRVLGSVLHTVLIEAVQ